MKKIIFSIIIIFLLFSTLNLTSVESKGLELDYPEIQETKPTLSMPLAEYVKYIFNFALWAVGLMAFIVMVLGGIRYLSSTGNASLQKDSKEQIKSALLGMAILFLSVLILNEITPNFMVLPNEALEKIGENGNFAFANGEDNLELDYPEVGGYKPEKMSDPLDKYVRYVFNFAVWGVGIAGLLMFLIAGTEYLLSPASPGLQSDAKDRMTQAIVGIVLLISSVLILSQINFEAAIISPEKIEPVQVQPSPGVWICREKIDGLPSFAKNYENTSADKGREILNKMEEKCLSIKSKTNLPESFKEEGKYIYLISSGDLEYGAVLHGGKNYTHGCQVVSENNKEITVEEGLTGGVSKINLSSITPFVIKKEALGEGVSLYNYRNYGEGLIEGYNYAPKFLPLEEHEDIKSDTYIGMEPCYSIKIEEEKNWIAIIRQIPNYGMTHDAQKLLACDVFDKSDKDLQDDYASYLCYNLDTGRKPCVGKIEVFKGYILE
jgi:hypothetical protein